MLSFQITWCKFEATVQDPKDINPFSETQPNAPKELPPLNIMSLTARTIVNHKENRREVVCATARIWSNSMSIPCLLSNSTKSNDSLICFQCKLMIPRLPTSSLVLSIPLLGPLTDSRPTLKHWQSQIKRVPYLLKQMNEHF